MLERLGRGGCYTFVGGLWLAFVPLILGIMRWGKSWREEKRKRGEVDAEDERVEDSTRVQMVNKDNSDHMSEQKA